MSDLAPTGTSDEAMLAAARESHQTSALARWLSARYERIESVGRIADWRPICEAATAAGITNAKGQPLTPAVTRRVWSRLKQRRRAATDRLSRAPLAKPIEPGELGTEPDRATVPVLAVVSPKLEQAVRPQDTAGAPAMVRLIERGPATPLPPLEMRSQEQVDTLIRIKGEFDTLEANRKHWTHAAGFAQEDRIRAEGEAHGVRLPDKRIFEPKDW